MASSPAAPMLPVSLSVGRIIRPLSLRSDALGGLTMDRNMERFIRRENLAHDRRLLADWKAKEAIPHG